MRAAERPVLPHSESLGSHPELRCRHSRGQIVEIKPLEKPAVVGSETGKRPADRSPTLPSHQFRKWIRFDGRPGRLPPQPLHRPGFPARRTMPLETEVPGGLKDEGWKRGQVGHPSFLERPGHLAESFLGQIFCQRRIPDSPEREHPNPIPIRTGEIGDRRAHGGRLTTVTSVRQRRHEEWARRVAGILRSRNAE